jgi:hypothetical protein
MLEDFDLRSRAKVRAIAPYHKLSPLAQKISRYGTPAGLAKLQKW